MIWKLFGGTRRRFLKRAQGTSVLLAPSRWTLAFVALVACIVSDARAAETLEAHRAEPACEAFLVDVDPLEEFTGAGPADEGYARKIERDIGVRAR